MTKKEKRRLQLKRDIQNNGLESVIKLAEKYGVTKETLRIDLQAIGCGLRAERDKFIAKRREKVRKLHEQGFKRTEIVKKLKTTKNKIDTDFLALGLESEYAKRKRNGQKTRELVLKLILETDDSKSVICRRARTNTKVYDEVYAANRNLIEQRDGKDTDLWNLALFGQFNKELTA